MQKQSLEVQDVSFTDTYLLIMLLARPARAVASNVAYKLHDYCLLSKKLHSFVHVAKNTLRTRFIREKHRDYVAQKTRVCTIVREIGQEEAIVNCTRSHATEKKKKQRGRQTEISMSLHVDQICAVSSQSHLNPSTYLPGGTYAGMMI